MRVPPLNQDITGGGFPSAEQLRVRFTPCSSWTCTVGVAVSTGRDNGPAQRVGRGSTSNVLAKTCRV